MSREIQTAFAQLVPLFSEVASHSKALGLQSLATENNNEILLRLTKDMVRLDWQARIIQSLCFQAMRDRNESIRERHGTTLEWVLNPDDMHKGPGFYSWLKKSDGLFWITGKVLIHRSREFLDTNCMLCIRLGAGNQLWSNFFAGIKPPWNFFKNGPANCPFCLYHTISGSRVCRFKDPF